MRRSDIAVLDALADLIADRLASRPLSGPGGREEGPEPSAGLGAPRDTPGALLTAAQVAERYAVSVDWVREHADELGVVRLGTGPRPRLRFDADRVAEALAASGTPAPQVQPGEPARSRRRRTPPGARSVPRLLPIRGRDA